MTVRHDPSLWWRNVLAGGGIAPRPTGSAVSERREFDVVVVGSGMTGYTAAILAHDAGSSVVILEAADEGGGTTWKSGGGLWIPDNHLMHAAGIKDDRDATLRLMAEVAHPDEFDPEAERWGMTEAEWDRMQAYYDNAGAAAKALEEAGAVRLMLLPSITGNYEGWVPYHYDIDHGPSSHYRTVCSTTAEGNVGLGFELIRQVGEAADRRGIELRVRHRVDGVVRNDDGDVVGVTVEAPDGPQTILARRGVVFASGGFPHNAELVGRYFRGPLYSSCAVETAQGDFVAIAQGLGAPIAGMRNGWLYEELLEKAAESRLSPGGVGVPSGDSMLVVNAEGQRVVNEKQVYQERCSVYWEPGEAGDYPNRALFMIYDEDVATDDAGWINFDLFVKGHPWVIEAPTLVGLADRIAERLEGVADVTGGLTLADGFAEQLSATVERFNDFARRGVDEDFARGGNPTDLDFHGTPRDENDKNPTMYPLRDEGPYYCVLLCGQVLDTNGGPVVNASAQVLDGSGEPIPGLYGVGNCVASVAGEGYFSGGGTLGPGTTFAYIAARHVSAQPQRATTGAIG